MKKNAISNDRNNKMNFTTLNTFIITFITIISILILLLLTVTVLSPLQPLIKVNLAFILILIWVGIIAYIYLKLRMAKLYPNET